MGNFSTSRTICLVFHDLSVPANLNQLITDQLSNFLKSFTIAQASSLPEALSKNPDWIIFFVLTATSRYITPLNNKSSPECDLVSTLTQLPGHVLLGALYMTSKPVAQWDPDLTTIARDFYCDREKGILFDTSDEKISGRISRNKEILKKIFDNK